MKAATGYLNDGSGEAPRLKIYLNLDTLVDLRPDSEWPGLDGLPAYDRLLKDGFEGVQVTSGMPPGPEAQIQYCGLDRINTPHEADAVAAKHAARGDQCITVHVGWGLEDDDEVDRLVEAVLAASQKYQLPIFIETHRATITQDVWRTVKISRRFPEVRFNGDFSHYYCGQELVYGDWNSKLAFMEPIFERIGFMHGRIASSGWIQAPIDSDLNSRPRQADGVANYLDHFKDLWTRAMRGFLRTAGPGDMLIFAPEILARTYYYARTFPDANGKLVEESDRYRQALIYRELAMTCFERAKKLVDAAQPA
jgi:hypothetical protein